METLQEERGTASLSQRRDAARPGLAPPHRTGPDAHAGRPHGLAEQSHRGQGSRADADTARPPTARRAWRCPPAETPRAV